MHIHRIILLVFTIIAFFAPLPLEAQTLPPPSSMLEGGESPVPVYEGFDALAPLLDYRGETTIVLNFWATWCAPCVEELPYFEEITREYDVRDVRVILVNLDFRGQLEKRLLPFIKKHELRSEILVLDDPDANAWIDRVDPAWSGAIPATVIYNADRRAFYEQSFTREELQTLVSSFTGTQE
ncbi:MAG: TlpA family protein disulfide reductase [Bacteroidetes bacterium]|nr:TlpA family protein disulfide reductase [Bacteroidota bacterium]